MACFCKMPLAGVPAAFASMNLAFSPPTIPIQMNAALAIGASFPSFPPRLDMQLAAMLPKLPSINLGLGGPALMQLKLAMGLFPIFDLPKLQLALDMAAQSFAANVKPMMQFMMQLKVLPLLKLALIARLQLALDALKINLAAGMPSMPTGSSSIIAKLALTTPQIGKLNLMLGLPIALQFSETLGMPVGKLPSFFSALARLKLPAAMLNLNLNLMLRISLVLDAIATIQAAFGPAALTPAGLASIAAKLKLYASLPLPALLPPLNLHMQLAALPPLPAIQAALKSPAISANLVLPSIPWLPTLSAMLGLSLGLNATFPLTVDCPCPFA